jgi:hypothetical protein
MNEDLRCYREAIKVKSRAVPHANTCHFRFEKGCFFVSVIKQVHRIIRPSETFT